MKLRFFNSLALNPAYIAARTTTGIDLLPMQWYFVLALAICTTLLSEFIAASAGWESGGCMRDRLVMAAMGFLIVSGTHVLPALACRFNRMLRAAILTAWTGCLLYALLGQATFFAFAQEDAGDARAMAVQVRVTPEHVDTPLGRGPTVIAQDEAVVIAKLERIKAARCMDGECRWRDARERALAAQFASLKVEAGEAKRHEAQEDRAQRHADEAQALRESRRADPVTSQLAPLFGWKPASLGMLRTYLPAVMLEFLPGLFWTLVFAGERRALPGVAATCGVLPAKAARAVAAEALKSEETPGDTGTAAKAQHSMTVDEDLAAAFGAVARLWESGRSVAIRLGRHYMTQFSANSK